MATPVRLTWKSVTATIAGGLAAVVLGIAAPAQASTSDVGSVVQPALTVPLPAATLHRGR